MKKIFSYISIFALLTCFLSYNNETKLAINENYHEKTVLLGGEAFGIKMFSDGVLVVEIEDSVNGSELPSPAIEADIKINDIIKSVNGISIKSNEQFTEIIRTCNKKELSIALERNGNTVFTTLTPQYDSKNILRVGMWIKDSAAGIGTITFYDPENGSFGALGHGIYESQTGLLIPLSYGEITKATIKDVNKSTDGKVGTLNGYFEKEIIGHANLNSEYGIYGIYDSSDQTVKKEIKLGTKDDLHTGDATIYCTIKENEVKEFDIRIRKLNHNNKGEDMIIEITDKELLDITGGIVQGMSGSPIIQDGKLVGAVTHVLVNNPTCGYGILIENMIDAPTNDK